VILGITAGILWTAAGFMQFAYAAEDEKAQFISWQWAMVSAGGSVGSLVAFGINLHATESRTSNAVYTIFICIMCLAILISLFFIVDPKHVTRDDGTHIAVFQRTTVAIEAKRLMALFGDWMTWVLIPGIFVAEMNLVGHRIYPPIILLTLLRSNMTLHRPDGHHRRLVLQPSNPMSQ
jgi:MFS family permease